MPTVIFRLIAAYVLLMGVATGVHILITPVVYVDLEATPAIWVVQNWLNVVALALMVLAGAVRKTVYDRSRTAEDYEDSTIRFLDHNVPFYAAAMLAMLYITYSLLEGTRGDVLLEMWFVLDAGVTVLGISTGIRILRGSGLRIFYNS